jgi:rubrerythrin
MEQAPSHCPRCDAAMVPLLFGFPDDEAMRAAEHGEIALAGCVLPEHGPPRAWKCPQCGYEGPEGGVDPAA